METTEIKMKNNDIKCKKPNQNDLPVKKSNYNDTLMTSSTISTISSLSSPVDSGVQLLDSENELTSVASGLSIHGSGCENESVTKFSCHPSINDTYSKESSCSDEILSKINAQSSSSSNNHSLNMSCEENCLNDDVELLSKTMVDKLSLLNSEPSNYFEIFTNKGSSSNSDEITDDVFEMEHPIKTNTDSINLMNLSLNSYELLDYTIPNTQLNDTLINNVESIDMHVSLSEEVNENLNVYLDANETTAVSAIETIPVIENPIVNNEQEVEEEKIVFRRQRKKKSKSDTPKKRVSFHEDILNSTKVDDIHINLGFITHESDDVSMNFLQRGFVKKSDVVKGRYSWAAEGDAPFYEKPHINRQIKSDIYIHQPRQYPSTSSSSSSSGSVSSSIDEEEDSSTSSTSGTDDNNNTNAKNDQSVAIVKEQKLPKSSCLKKAKHKKYINTNIVQEEITHPIKKKTDTNLLLDANIFGSLKNILNFSTSVPLAERGVPEGQEDISIYSSSHDVSINSKRKSFTKSFSEEKCPDDKIALEVPEYEQAEPLINDKINMSKTNLKLTRKEGFYPSYVPNQNLPANIIVCDSNVYEHKGISYSYEYDNFQKTFEQQQKQQQQTSKNLLYKKWFGDFKFFSRNAKDDEDDLEQALAEEEFEVIPSSPKSELLSEIEEKSLEKPSQIDNDTTQQKKFVGASSTFYLQDNWTDDATTISDMSELRTTSSTNNISSSLKHLDSPKRNINRNNHYSIHSSFKGSFNQINSDLWSSTKSMPSNLLKSTSTLKSSIINRFLANITVKNIIDMKLRKKSLHCMDIYTKKCKVAMECNKLIDMEIECEISLGRKKQQQQEIKNKWRSKTDLISLLKKQICQDDGEILNIFPIRSCYTTNGETIPLLLVLTSTTLYILRYKNNIQSFTNYFILPYMDLNTILIGPCAQIIQFSNNEMDIHCMITTGCTKTSHELISYLEMAMRRNRNTKNLLSVKQMDMNDMIQLRNSICKNTSVDKNEEFYYHSIVSIQDSEENLTHAPLGPIKEGPLMYKLIEINDEPSNKRWESAYFILKAGVLYLLSSPSQKIPLKIFNLLNGACRGACKITSNNSSDFRPHTFRLIIEDTILYLAAPNECNASEWLQELIRVARGVYTVYKENDIIQSCSFLMTSNHLLTVREIFPESKIIDTKSTSYSEQFEIKEPQVLSCAAIIDLISFRLPSAEQSWCILEFSCREIHEHGGDWIIYFATIAELESFIFTLEKLWEYNNENGECFPLSTIPEDDPINGKCMDIYTSLINILSPNMVHLQIL